MADESSALGQPYEIVSVERAEPPPGAEGPYWYRYVIAFEGINNIHGCRQGGLKAVTRAVEGDCRPIKRTAVGAREQTSSRPPGAEEETPHGELGVLEYWVVSSQ